MSVGSKPSTSTTTEVRTTYHHSPSSTIFFPAQKHIQYAGVQYIISSSIEALIGHPHRRYIQVETAFFWKWWQHQEDAFKQQVIELVNNGQLEITNGAWSMNDEAASHYHSTIDQFTWGF
jgi:lysosomal alpha-mannosidase